MEQEYGSERAVLENWAQGFEDRDGKFVQEFQLTYESSFWELYLYAALRTPRARMVVVPIDLVSGVQGLT